VKFHIALSAVVTDTEHHRAIYREMSSIQDIFVATIPSLSLTSFDMDEISDEGEEYFDERTMFKVVDTITMAGFSEHDARLIVNELQNAGILFRERRGSA
jgi:hypothetical protein